MVNGSPQPTYRTWLGCTVVATADRLVIRPPMAYWGVAALFLLLAALLPWIMALVGLGDDAIVLPVTAMLATGVLFFVILLGRWWTLDRTADSVRYFPWRLCAVSAIRGVRVVERRIGKLNLGRAYTVDLDLAGGSTVRFAGFSYARLGAAEALNLATIIAEWLNVPVTQESLSPVA